MHLAKIGGSNRTLVYSAAVLCLAVAALLYGAEFNTTDASTSNARAADKKQTSLAPAATFPGTGVGPIPDGGATCAPSPGAPLNVSFAVTGMTAPLTVVQLDLTFNPAHTWVGDLDVTLKAPGGSPFHTIFTNTNNDDSSNVAGPYMFFDAAQTMTTWWAAAAGGTSTFTIPAGSYRTSDGTGTNTLVTPVFAGLTTGQVNGTWTATLTDGCEFDTGSVSAASLTLTGAAAAVVKSRADFDGDGRTDLSVFRPSEGNWYLNRSTAGFSVINFGLSSDTLVPGDYDGDGKADTAIFRPAANSANPDFWVVNSNGFTLSGVSWGTTGDIPVSGDYNGDSRTDFAVFRPSTGVWYILNSTSGTNTIEPFGLTGDVPLAFDLENDGKTNLAVFRPSSNTWYIARNTGVPATNFEALPFGSAGDSLVPADYDGDNKDDPAVFRPSTGQWFIRRSSNGVTTITLWGATGDVPVPGDYDGDGTDDLAIYRNGQWWLLRSTLGVSVQNFGVATDRAIPKQYIP